MARLKNIDRGGGETIFIVQVCHPTKICVPDTCRGRGEGDFLSLYHEKRSLKVDGSTADVMVYNMEDFLNSSLEL